MQSGAHERTNETGWLAGRVVDLHGRALLRATVHWMGWVEDVHRTLTVAATAEGRFQLGPLPARPDHVLWVEAPGHARLRVGDHGVAQVAVIPGAVNDLGEIALAPEAVVTGRLLDAAGAPITGATIDCTLLYYTGAGSMCGNGPAIALATGSDGVFRVGSLPIGEIRLTFRVPDHPLFYRSRHIRGDVELGDIRVVRERRRVRGRVVDPEGRPIGGALVFVNGDEECGVRTDADGTFTLEARHHQIRSVSVDDDGNRNTSSVEDPDDVQIELEPARFLEGCVVDAATSEPIPIEDVSICEVRRREIDGTIQYVMLEKEWKSPETGRFRAQVQALGLACGEPTKLQVYVASPGRRRGELEVTVHRDTPWPVVEVRLVRGTPQPEPVRTSGRVPDAPAEAGLLSCWTTVAENDALNTEVCRGAPVSVGGYPFAWAGVTAEGSFRLPARWERSILCLQQAGRHARWYLPHPTAHGAVLERVACGSIDGSVTGLRAAAAGHTHVVLFSRGLLRLTARVVADGSFWFPAVPAGTFWLRAGDDDFARVRESLRAPLQLDDWMVLAKPDVGAVTVTVHADETTRGVEVPFDPSPP